LREWDSPSTDPSRSSSAFHPEAPHTALTWGLGTHGLLTNIAITTLGNLIGGTLFVAVPFQLVTKLQEQGR
jgi:formate/nitrite transporter FocA (FNT family)